jgi:hypothetical protein
MSEENQDPEYEDVADDDDAGNATTEAAVACTWQALLFLPAFFTSFGDSRERNPKRQ